MTFTEIADRVWVARYEWFDVNVTVVRGSAGLLVVDTHASARAAREVVDEVRALGAGELVAVVNTHEHFDHTFGNGAFRAAYGDIPIHAHEVAAARWPHPAVVRRRRPPGRPGRTRACRPPAGRGRRRRASR